MSFALAALPLTLCLSTFGARMNDALESATSQAARITTVVSESRSGQIQSWRAHYVATADELAAVDTKALSVQQRTERTRLIGVLRSYAERADFGRNVQVPGARVPLFVDREGRRCAVAELLHASGEDALVRSVQVQRNGAWVCELGDRPELLAWLDRSGLTLREAMRIQGPGMRWQSGPSDAARDRAGFTGPGDTIPTGATGAGRATPGAPTGGGGAATPNAPVGGGTTNGPRGGTGAVSTRPTIVALTTTDDDGWWLWWEYNKVEFLRPNRLSFDHIPVSTDDPLLALRIAADRARSAARPLIEAGLASADGGVRGAAVVALGRANGRGAVQELIAALVDSNVAVRERAILALGATGSLAAAQSLLSIARTGNLEGRSDRIAPNARPLAIVALAMLRVQGIEPGIDREIAHLVAQRVQSEREQIGVAAMVYATLTGSEELQPLALRLACDESESPSVRCRATEALRHSKDEQALARLLDLVHGARLDLRRSASLALGRLQGELVLPALQTAFETEAEPLTKGFTLLSIGRRGDAAARAFLAKQLTSGENGMRRWAALGLGLWAREQKDVDAHAELGTLLCAALDREKNQEARAAYWIALGLVKDQASLARMTTALAEGSDPRQRVYAAQGLALLGGDEARTRLLARLPDEKSEIVRIGIAQAIAIFGAPQDASLLGAELDRLQDGSLQAQASSAVALHGTPESLALLGSRLRAPQTSNVRRAASLEAFGMLLSQSTPLGLTEASRQANYTVFSPWLDDMFQTTL